MYKLILIFSCFSIEIISSQNCPFKLGAENFIKLDFANVDQDTVNFLKLKITFSEDLKKILDCNFNDGDTINFNLQKRNDAIGKHESLLWFHMIYKNSIKDCTKLEYSDNR